jgi:ankyrin repeat protein
MGMATEDSSEGPMTTEDLARLIASGRGAGELPQYLAAGGSVDAIAPQSQMPLLHLACEHQNLEAIRALVQAGADLNRRDHYGQTALHIAVDIDIDSILQSGGSQADVEFKTTLLLLALGANADIQDGRGRTPRQLAAGYGMDAAEKFDQLVRHGT